MSDPKFSIGQLVRCQSKSLIHADLVGKSCLIIDIFAHPQYSYMDLFRVLCEEKMAIMFAEDLKAIEI